MLRLLTMEKKINKQQEGISLLETLLVLVVISIIAIVSMQLIQRNVTEVKINKTIQEIGLIIEGAQAYYGVHKAFPGDNVDPKISQLTQNCVWQKSATDDPCYKVIAKTGNLFTMTLTIPPNQANASQIAHRIADRLPTAEVDGTTITIYAGRPNTQLATSQSSTLSTPHQPTSPLGRVKKLLGGGADPLPWNGAHVIAIFPFFSNGYTYGDNSPQGAPITLAPCEKPDMQRKVYFMLSDYSYDYVSTIWGGKYHLNKQVIGTCPTVWPATPCAMTNTSPVCDVKDAFKNLINNGGLQNPVVIPGNTPDPVVVNPFICNVNESFEGGQQISTYSSWSMGLAIEMCTY